MEKKVKVQDKEFLITEGSEVIGLVVETKSHYVLSFGLPTLKKASQGERKLLSKSK